VRGFDLPLFENAEYLHSVLLPVLFRCGVAALCGGLIGFERELKDKPAGLRTNILICVGAALYMLIGLLIVHAGGETASDPSRIASQVVTGIGFLGAGSIIPAFIITVMVVLTLVALGSAEVRLIDRNRQS